MDGGGVVPEALAECLARVHVAGRRVKFLYTVPSFHNPAGVTLSARRRPEALRICHRAGVLIVADNPYGLLGFDTRPLRSRPAGADHGRAYLGSLPTTSAPSARLAR